MNPVALQVNRLLVRGYVQAKPEEFIQFFVGKPNHLQRFLEAVIAGKLDLLAGRHTVRYWSLPRDEMLSRCVQHSVGAVPAARCKNLTLVGIKRWSQLQLGDRKTIESK